MPSKSTITVIGFRANAKRAAEVSLRNSCYLTGFQRVHVVHLQCLQQTMRLQLPGAHTPPEPMLTLGFLQHYTEVCHGNEFVKRPGQYSFLCTIQPNPEKRDCLAPPP